jgi:hypothetical protein
MLNLRAREGVHIFPCPSLAGSRRGAWNNFPKNMRTAGHSSLFVALLLRAAAATPVIFANGLRLRDASYEGVKAVVEAALKR